MVHALHRARRWLTSPHGVIIDIRPTDVVARLEVQPPGGDVLPVGDVIVEDARRARHAAADAALQDVTRAGLFRVEAEHEFSFYYYGESAAELRDHVAAHWRQTTIAADTAQQADTLMHKNPGSRVWLREAVGIRTLQKVPMGA